MNDAARAVDNEPGDEAQILDTIDRWVERDLRPIVREYDHADRYPAGVVEQMKELGLFGATVGAEYGGLGLSAGDFSTNLLGPSAVWGFPTAPLQSPLLLPPPTPKYTPPHPKP